MNLKERFRDDFTPKNLYVILMAFGILLSFASMYLLHGHNWLHFLFVIEGDAFGDFFNTLHQAYYKDPYVPMESVYPALANLFYRFMARFVSHDAFTYGIKASITSLTVFLMYNIVTVTVFTMLIKHWLKGKELFKNFVIFLILFSAPFLYQFERANIIFVTMIFLLAFMVFKDSDNKILREIALICFAVAAVTKIYPIIFGVLLLKEKRYMESIRALLYTALLFVIPFYAYGGLDRIPIMLDNIRYLTGATTTFGSDRINITNTLGYFQYVLYFYIPSTLLSTSVNILFVFSMIMSFFIKTTWKTVLLLTTLMAAIPGFSNMYALIYIVIPLIMFLNSVEGKRVLDYLYGFLFFTSMSMFIFIPDGPFEVYPLANYRYNLTTFTEGMSVIILVILLNIEGLIGLIKLLKIRFQKGK